MVIFDVLLMVDLVKVRSLFAEECFDLMIFPQMLFYYLVTMKILMQLLITELVLGFQLNYWRVSQDVGDLLDCVEDGVEDRGLLAGDLWMRQF